MKIDKIHLYNHCGDKYKYDLKTYIAFLSGNSASERTNSLEFIGFNTSYVETFTPEPVAQKNMMNIFFETIIHYNDEKSPKRLLENAQKNGLLHLGQIKFELATGENKNNSLQNLYNIKREFHFDLSSKYISRGLDYQIESEILKCHPQEQENKVRFSDINRGEDFENELRYRLNLTEQESDLSIKEYISFLDLKVKQHSVQVAK